MKEKSAYSKEPSQTKRSYWNIIKPAFLFLVFLNLILASWYVLHNDIHFPSDIARDFFLLDEIKQKWLVLIGARTSSGLFHGPLWLYINFPAYLLGNGNPVTVGWNWILLIIVSLGANFFIAKKLFDEKTAYIFTLMMSLYWVFHAHAFINPHGAMLVFPACFFFFIRYIQAKKRMFLVLFIFLLGCITQFQMALGIPLAILCFGYLVYFCIVNKRKMDLLFLLLFIIPVSNFLLFDLRHEFLISKKVLEFLSPIKNYQAISYPEMLVDRISALFLKIEFIRDGPKYINFVILLCMGLLIKIQIKNDQFKQIYYLFLYFFIGYFILSFVNRGTLLSFYLYPIFPLVFLIFSSLITSKYKSAFLILFLTVIGFNYITAFKQVHESQMFIGKTLYSWKFLHTMSEKLVAQKSNPFGYFVYAPDAFAYEPKYAMLYTVREHHLLAKNFQKLPTTYIIAQPPPPNNPYMKDTWWTVNEVHITSSPSAVINFENGYKIEKYLLNPDEIATPISQGVDTGLNFR